MTHMFMFFCSEVSNLIPPALQSKDIVAMELTAAEAATYFESFDADGNGSLDRGELLLMLKMVKGRDDVDFSRAITAWSTDGDQEVRRGVAMIVARSPRGECKPSGFRFPRTNSSLVFKGCAKTSPHSSRLSKQKPQGKN